MISALTRDLRISQRKLGDLARHQGVRPDAQPRRTALKALTLACVGLAIATHFAATLVYLMPLNPLKVRVLTAVNAYMNPYFSQHWNMFAPEPILDDDRIFLISCRVDEGGALKDEPLTDVTTRLHGPVWRWRISPAFRLTREQMTTIAILNPPQDVLSEHLAKLAEDEDSELARVGKQVQKQKEASGELGMQILARISSAECDRLYGAGRTVAMHTMMLAVAAAPFSKRNTGEVGEVKKADFGWLPHESVSSL